MTPLWIFPAYPLLLVGPFASILTAVTAPNEEIASDFLAIIVGGVVVQGMGFLLALTMHATYIYRLMTQKLPQTGSRPGMFISVGPSGFTSTALIGLARNLPKVVGAAFMGEEGYIAARITKIMGYWAGIWL
jgi:tellurite resistance protein TehA-like permease